MLRSFYKRGFYYLMDSETQNHVIQTSRALIRIYICLKPGETSTNLRIAAHDRLHFLLAQLFDAQQLVVCLLKMRAVALAPNGRMNELHNELPGVRALRLELRP